MASFTQWIWSLSSRLIPTTLLLDSASNVEVDWNKEKEKRRPRFEDLPLQKDDPAWPAWGLWGADDELGTLNLLTEETIREASKEIKEGIAIPLNLPIEAPLLPMNPARKRCNHNILSKDMRMTMNSISIHKSRATGMDFDTTLTKTATFPGTTTTRSKTTLPAQPPVLAFAFRSYQDMERRGIVCHGVLLDWRSYALRKGIKYSPFGTYAIPLHQLLEVAVEQHVPFQRGDILLIRSGWTEEYMLLSDEQQVALAQRKQRAFVGVEGSKGMIKWHWDNGVAAVAGDTNAYEAWPPAREDCICCHEVFLSGWGMPIGKVCDLEALARTCKRLGRWTFFLTSSPLNLENGVASPSNAIATF